MLWTLSYGSMLGPSPGKGCFYQEIDPCAEGLWWELHPATRQPVVQFSSKLLVAAGAIPVPWEGEVNHLPNSLECL